MSEIDLIAIDDLPDRAPWWPLSPGATRRLCLRGALEHQKIGRQYHVTRESLEKFIEAHTVREGQASPLLRDDLYAIAGVYTRRVKIGRSCDVALRLKALQAGSPDHLILLRSAAGLGDRERQLHECLSAHRLHGEWFSSEVTAAVASEPSFSDWIDGVFAANGAQGKRG